MRNQEYGWVYIYDGFYFQKTSGNDIKYKYSKTRSGVFQTGKRLILELPYYKKCLATNRKQCLKRVLLYTLYY